MLSKLIELVLIDHPMTEDEIVERFDSVRAQYKYSETQVRHAIKEMVLDGRLRYNTDKKLELPGDG